MNFHIDPFHFFNKKLLNETVSTKTIVDWKSLLNERKKLFPESLFLVLEQNKSLFTDALLLQQFKVSYRNKTPVFSFENKDNLNIHILQIHQNTQEVILEHFGTGLLNIFHENLISQKGESNLIINASHNVNYHFINHNFTEQIFHQQILLNIQDNVLFDFYKFEKPQISKNKVDIQINLQNHNHLQLFFVGQLKEQQLHDNTIEVIHNGNYSTSLIEYLSLNGGKSVSQINSIIKEKTLGNNTQQKIKHILLNESAQSYSKPNLMIYTPDVIAAHGNSIGSFNTEDLFYLQQRGLEQEKAKSLITDSYLVSYFDKTHYTKQLHSLFKGDIL